MSASKGQHYMPTRLEVAHGMTEPPNWRVYVGHPDVDKLDQTYPDEGGGWAKARIVLAEEIVPFLTDTCMDCRLDGTNAFNCLAALGYHQEFRAEIDGDYYCILKERGTP